MVRNVPLTNILVDVIPRGLGEVVASRHKVIPQVMGQSK